MNDLSDENLSFDCTAAFLTGFADSVNFSVSKYLNAKFKAVFKGLKSTICQYVA